MSNILKILILSFKNMENDILMNPNSHRIGDNPELSRESTNADW